jgi:hypothetical protein
MANGVSTRNKRFEFVNGWLTGGTDPADGSVECGDGTAFPMQVTLDQVAEIFYRVKDAWFTGGSASWEISGSPQTINAATDAPANRTLEIDGSTYQKRGYTKLGAYPYNGATYDAGIGNYYSDIADNENGMWKDAWNDPDHVDAFSYEQDDPNSIQGGDTEWWGDTGLGVYAKVFRGKRVAVVKADPADGLYAPTNQFFLEIEMYWFDYGFVPFGGSTNIYNSQGGFGNFSSRAVLISNYILRLATGDATCPVYFDALGSTNETGTDFIHEPQVWWPYAKDNPAVPVWDTDNGAKL